MAQTKAALNVLGPVCSAMRGHAARRFSRRPSDPPMEGTTVPRDDIPESWRALFDSDEKSERVPGVPVELIEAAGASIGQLCEKLTLYAGWLRNVRLSEARESGRIFRDSETRDSSVLLLRLAATVLERLGHPEHPVLTPI